MEISNPLPMDRMYTDEGNLVHCKKVSIGPWNMDMDATIEVLHGLGILWPNIIAVNVWIIPDVLAIRAPLQYFNNAVDPNLNGGGIQSTSVTGITLSRRTGGPFDSVNFDDGVINRGVVFFWYFE